MAEPIYRIVSQLKKAKGKSVKTVIDFLSEWLSINDLEQHQFDKPRNNINPYDNWVREDTLSAYKYSDYEKKSPVCFDDELIKEYFMVEDALASLLETGSAEMILALPVGIANTIEEKIQYSSCAYMLIEIALLAVRIGGTEEFLRYAIIAISTSDRMEGLSLRPEEEKTAQIIIACIRILLGHEPAGLHALEYALSLGEFELTKRQLSIIKTTVNCPFYPIKNKNIVKLLSCSINFVSGQKDS